MLNVDAFACTGSLKTNIRKLNGGFHQVLCLEMHAASPIYRLFHVVCQRMGVYSQLELIETVGSLK